MSEIIDLQATFVRQTPKAICVEASDFPGSKSRDTIWLPFSQIEVFKPNGSEPIRENEGLIAGQEIEISLPRWLAHEKGMI